MNEQLKTFIESNHTKSFINPFLTRSFQTLVKIFFNGLFEFNFVVNKYTIEVIKRYIIANMKNPPAVIAKLN